MCDWVNYSFLAPADRRSILKKKVWMNLIRPLFLLRNHILAAFFFFFASRESAMQICFDDILPALARYMCSLHQTSAPTTPAAVYLRLHVLMSTLLTLREPLNDGTAGCWSLSQLSGC